MGWGAVAQRLQKKPELCLGLFGTNAHEGEDFFLQLHLMDADAATTDLDAVQRQIVSLGTSLGRIAVEQRQIFF